MAILPDSSPDGDCESGTGYKQCRKCGACLPATPEYFSRDAKGKNGLLYKCKTCSRSAANEYKKSHKADVSEYMQAYYQRRKDERAVYKKHYRKANKDKIADFMQEYRTEHKARLSLDKKRYEAENPEKGIQRGHKRRAKERAGGGFYTKTDLAWLYEWQSGCCCWCSRPLVNRLVDRTAPRADKFTVDHIIPIAQGGSNWGWNLALACAYCNTSRNNRYAWLDWQPPDPLEGIEPWIVRAILLEMWWRQLRARLLLGADL